ncbi:cadherin domain-containing protein [Rhizorhapis suberifaciens]|uniref:Ca2+-binding RTX toxin-like protein n=1 Tax=Rhizorhapis suberifaciens TaxID=13656 RepID=A0A840HYA0_9SPHN|nr:cadherin domain-containing protein [Rhizorhapis suberifaciens]MBB4642631.1 Ca2+-binding RTX toxin-like protein [Rhizorhapis suberifaciens]
MAGGNELTGVVYSAALKTLGDNLGDVLDGVIGRQSEIQAAKDAFSATGHEFLSNLKSAGIGAVSSFLTAELVNAIGLDGFTGQLANSASGAYVSAIIEALPELVSGAQKLGDVLGSVNVGNVIGGFVGSFLASKVISFDTVGGQIGASVGAALAPIGVTALLAPAGLALTPIGFAVVAFVGFIVGGLIGSLFGGTPSSWADAQWSEGEGKFIVANVRSKKGGSKDAARSLASSASETFNAVLAATGGTLLEPAAVQSGSYGMRGKKFVYKPKKGGDITERFSGEDAATRAIGYGVYTGLADPDFKIAGGDIYVKRALYNMFEMGGLDPRNFDTNVLLGNISAAQQYESYLANSSVINALVSAEPNSVFAIETLLTLARADELGLTRRAASDWFGGFSYLMGEAQTSAANVEFGFDYDPYSGQISRLTGVGDYVLGDAIDIAGQTTIEGTTAGETIDLRTGSLADQRGFTVNGHLSNDIAATGSDFTTLTTSVTFAAADWRKTVTVTVANDGLAEATESFLGRLSNAPDMQIMGGEAVATIVDGTAALPTLMVGNSYAWENDGYAVFRLSLSKAASSAVTVALALANDKASGLGVDYGSTGAANIQVSTDGVNWTNATSATFAAGVTQLFVRTAIVADNVANPAYVGPVIYNGQVITPGNGEPEFLNIEANERFTLKATVTAGAAALANGASVVSGTGTIVDGAGTEPLVWIDNVVLDEASGQARFTLSRSRTMAASTTVDFATADNRVLDIDVAATVDGGDGNDTIYASNRGDNIFGGAGSDTLYGGRLDDWLLGGDGDDVLDAGTADQNALGGDGNYLNGGAGNDILKGREGSDWLEGGDGVDTLTGGAGDDVLAGGASDGDSLKGAAGGDYYLFRLGDGKDVVEDGLNAAGSTDGLYTAVQQKNSNADLKDWTGSSIYSENGAPLNGSDRVVFGAGIGLGDIVLVRSGTSGAPGMDLIIKIAQNGVLTGDELTLTGWFDSYKKVEWLEFADGQAIRVGDFTSFVVGTAENDVIIGTDGNDFVVGGDGDDRLQLLGGDDVGIGGRGHDEIGGDDGNDILVGGSDSDMILGGSGNDLLSGDGADDDLYGGLGNDLLTGGHGNDMIVGGVGNDVVRISRGDGLDTLIDDYAGTWEVVSTGNGWNTAGGYTYDSATNRVLRNGTEVVFDGSNWLGRFNYDYNTATGIGTLSRLVPAAGGQVGKDVSTSDSDALEFDMGINIQDLVMQRSGNDLLIGISTENAGTQSFASIGDQIVLKDWFVSTTANSPIERFVFAATGTQDMTATAAGVQGTDANNTLTGTASVDWITGGAGDDTVNGGDGNDILNGNTGQDSVTGGTGADVLYGGSGDDILIGGAGADILSGGADSDTASYAGASGAVYAYLDNAAVNAGDATGDSFASIENLTGGAGADHLGGDAGENVLSGGSGADNDVLMGGLGDDIYTYDVSTGSDIIQDGKFAVEQIVNAQGVLVGPDGTPNNGYYTVGWTYLGKSGKFYQYRLLVTIAATGEVALDGTYSYTSSQASAPAPSTWALTDWKNGFARVGSSVQVTREKFDASVAGGDDTLELGSGISLSDLSASWSGNDLVLSARGTVTIKNQAVANQQVETLQLHDGLSADLRNLRLNSNGVDGVDDLILGSTGNDTLSGLTGNDALSGAAGNDTLSGGDGDDDLEGGAGADTLSGDAGIDTARYVRSSAAVTVNLNLTTAQSGGDAAGDILSGIENVTGSIIGDDVLTGDANGNVLNGLDGNDTLTGNGGDDVLIGDIGNDTLDGGDGSDNMSAGDGNDTASGGIGNDIIDGGAGVDIIHGDAGNDQLVAGDGDDTVYGDGGDDVVIGDAGNDGLWGGDGNDQLTGGLGDDMLQGGLNDDVYLFSKDSGLDTVVDASGVNQIIFDATVAYGDIWLARTGNDLLITIAGGTTKVTLSNFYAASNPTTVRRIATQTHAIYLAYAQPLIDQMSAVALAAPASVPAAITNAAAGYWWAGGLAAPVVTDIALVASEDVTTSIQASGVVDHDGNITGYQIGQNAAHGTVTLDTATGQFTYLGAADYFGPDSFTIIVTDADQHSAEFTVDVTVNPVNDAPTDISYALLPPSLDGIPENQTGIIVGDLAATDVDLPQDSDFGQSIFTTSDSRFEVIGGKTLKLRAGQALDFEATPTVQVSVTATDRNGAGLSFTKTLTFAVADGIDIINGTAANDTLSGAAGIDQIYGFDGNDTLAGNGGDDLLDGGNGDDSLSGGDGNDALTGGSGIDTLDGGIGDDTLSGGSQNDTLSSGSGNDNLSGDANDDTLYGDAGNDTLNGGDGNDFLIGGAGADALVGGLGTDIASYRWNSLNALATAGITVNLSNAAANTGNAIGDTHSGVEGLEGTEYNDNLTGDANANPLYGAGGDDLIYGGNGNDSLYGQAGYDTLYGDGGNDILDGSDGDDIIHGGSGNDTLTGGNGNDQLFADDGDDVLDGGAGSDTMTGGAGNDTYVILTTSGADTINNYHIDLSENDLLGYQGTIQDKDLWFEHIGDDLVITVVATGTVTTIKDWFATASLAAQTNYQIKFIQANASNVINVNGLIDLMATKTKPTTIAARDALMADTNYYTSWQTYWGNNPPPVVSAIANQMMSEDTPLAISITASDTLDGSTPSAPNSVGLVYKVYNKTTGLEDYSLIQSVSFGSPDAFYQRTATITPVANAYGTAQVVIWAYDGGGRYSQQQAFDVTVGAKADMPAITLAKAGAALDGKGSFHGGQTIPLSINVNFPDTDGSEAQTILITGVPAGLSLNKGTYNSGTATWTLTSAQLSGLALTGPAAYYQDFNLSVTAKAVENSNGDTATTTAVSVPVIVNAAPTDIGVSGSIIENPAYGAGGVTVAAVDPDGGSFIYSLTDNASGRFAINSSTGAITVATSTPSQIDYEASASHVYSITVQAIDNGGLSYTKTLSVAIADQNERPTFTATGPFGINENVGTGTVVGTVAASDVDSYTASYGTRRYYFAGGSARASADGAFSVSSTSADGKFQINATTGQITVVGGINYEALGSNKYYNETVYVTDDLNNSTARMNSTTVRININDLNEAPTLNPLSITVNEQPGNATSWQWRMLASDPDSDPAKKNFYYTLSGTNSDYFLINSSTGQISLAKSLNYEDASQPKSFNLTVGLWDQGNGGGNYVQSTFAVTAVNNVNEAPSASISGTFTYGGGGTYPPMPPLISATITGYDPDTNSAFNTFSGGYVTNYQEWNGSSWITPDQPTATSTSTPGTWSIFYVPQRSPARFNYYVVSSGQSSQIYSITITVGSSFAAPLVLDLDGDGVELASPQSSTIRFDMDADGVRDITGWAAADDGLLAIDLNGNGMIDDVSEISFQPDLEGAVSDLEGLRAYDSNNDGLFDTNDARFADFRIWQDLDQDGVSDSGELKSLDEAGIAAINLTLTITGQTWDSVSLDNLVYGYSDFVRTDGSVGTIGDAFFSYLRDGEMNTIIGSHVEAVGIDFNGNGVSITDLSGTTIAFDQANGGAVVPSAWVGTGDALLGMDINGDGLIGSGAELALGDQSFSLNPLRGLDENSDGRLDANDSRFGELLLWQDANQDGVSQASEMKSLSQAGISALVLPGIATPFTLGIGESRAIDSFTVEFTDGSTGSASNLLLAYTEPQIAAPIVLDFDEDGAGLVPLAGSPTKFDMNGDGILDQTGWIEQGDALLALDRNSNGVIDNISEISFVGDKAGAQTDLEGLVAFDSNGNGILDAGDTQYGNFRLWFDGDIDGLTDTGELKTLAEAGVTSISLTGAPTGEATGIAGANVVYNIASYTLTGGRQGRVLDAGFAYSAGTGGTTDPDGGEGGETPSVPPPPAITLQSSQWDGKSKHYRIASASGGLHVIPSKAQGAFDARAGLIAPAAIVEFRNRSFGMMSAILVDLDGDGLEARRKGKTKANFDMDGDGVADNTGWVSGKDGMLVIDRNGDGEITAASEISFLTEKANAKSAWEGLAELDTSRDGKISALDTRFGDLKIWADGNANGVTDDGELKTLTELGIKEIGLSANAVSSETKLGRNLPLSTAAFTWDSGVTGTIGNVALAFDPSSVEETSSPELSRGTVSAQLGASLLMQAMSRFGAGSTDDLSHGTQEYGRERLDFFAARAA